MMEDVYAQNAELRERTRRETEIYEWCNRHNARVIHKGQDGFYYMNIFGDTYYVPYDELEGEI